MDVSKLLNMERSCFWYHLSLGTWYHHPQPSATSLFWPFYHCPGPQHVASPRKTWSRHDQGKPRGAGKNSAMVAWTWTIVPQNGAGQIKRGMDYSIGQYTFRYIFRYISSQNVISMDLSFCRVTTWKHQPYTKLTPSNSRGGATAIGGRLESCHSCRSQTQSCWDGPAAGSGPSKLGVMRLQRLPTTVGCNGKVEKKPNWREREECLTIILVIPCWWSLRSCLCDFSRKLVKGTWLPKDLSKVKESTLSYQMEMFLFGCKYMSM